MSLLKTAALTLIFVGLTISVHAQNNQSNVTNVQFCLFCPLQVVPPEFDVHGARFTVPFGVNRVVYGLDTGIWSVTTGYQYGFQANGLVAYHEQDADGFNLAGIVNYTGRDSTGCIIGGIFSEVQNKITGFQTALVTAKARQVAGVQLSLFNYCEDLSGVQLGLINIYNNGTIPFTILFNIGNSDRKK